MRDPEVIEVPERIDRMSASALAARLEAAAGPVVLRGGGAFCLGMDLSAEGDAAAGFDAFGRALSALSALEVPSIAVVEGAALGGGLGLAAACDLVIAGPEARFGLPELTLGLAPLVILPALLGRVSPQAVRRLALSGASIGAEEALRVGLADAAPRDVEVELARTLRHLARLEPGALAVLKETLSQRAAGGTAEEAAWASAQLASRPVARERTRRFAEGGAPWAW